MIFQISTRSGTRKWLGIKYHNEFRKTNTNYLCFGVQDGKSGPDFTLGELWKPD